ncbi:PAS domain-containing protein [Segetibacter sp. 3557_3]|uniref:PAS domain-containing sensor histidine kinase n=1 Tax=Segetibacter sp. 3557_3 TaxID=2547429 RepID=UPI0014049F04|nr:PAS domain-containing protein [Segetibacter sp. 3557_3]
MLNDSINLTADDRSGYIRLFDAFPGNHLLIEANPPHYTLLAVTPQRLIEVGLAREAIIGKPLFEVHPGNSNDPSDNGPRSLRNSLALVLHNKQAHHLPVQRYDLPNDQGSFSEMYWRASNRPVLNQEGEVAFIIHTAENITQEVHSGRMAEKMKGMEQAYNLFMQTPIPVCILMGPDLIIEMANDPTLQLWGRGREVIGLPLEHALPEVIGQGYISLMDEVRESGIARQVYESPVKLIRNGKEENIYVNYIYQPYFEDRSPKAVGVLAIGNEVTMQVHLRSMANESEGRFRTIADQAPMMVFLADTEAVVTFWNRYWLDFTGQSFEQSLGRSWHDIVHPDDCEELLQSYFGAARSQQNYSVEARMMRSDGAYRYFLFTGGPHYAPDGSIRGSIGTGVDIHDRKLAENALQESEINLRNTILRSPVATCILKGRSLVVYIANTRMFELWGRGPEKLMDKPVFEALPEARNQGAEKLLLKVFDTGVTITANESAIQLLREGVLQQIYVNYTFQPYYHANGSIEGVVAVAIEVTEQVKARREIEQIVTKRTNELAEANEALTASNRELERSNINLSEFAYAASHDLKEPIRKMQVFADRIKASLGDRLSANERHFFQRMEAAAERMASLIDSLLSFSEVSIQPKNHEDVDFNELIDVVLDDLQLQIENKKAIIEVDPLFSIKGHHRQLQQAFQNLLANALKYAKPGGVPHIKVSCNKVVGKETPLALPEREHERAFYCVTVKDNGIGFEQEHADRIFNVFTRLPVLPEYKGTGIGLSIVRKVIENHHGHIWAESRLNEGASFNVLLPVEPWLGAK